jgi:hypothetical protein
MLTSQAFITVSNTTRRTYLFLGVYVTTLYRQMSYWGRGVGGRGIGIPKSTQDGYYASRTIVAQTHVF